MQRMTQTRRGEIVPLPSGERGRELVSGPATRWLPADGMNFPIEKLAGGDVGQVGGSLALTDADRVLGTVAGSEEYATPVSRAKGQLVRLIPFTVAWALLTWGLVWVLQLSAPYFLLGFAVLTAATFVKLNGQEFSHSRNGLERHRVDAAADLAEKQMDQNHELKKMALTTYLEIAKAQYLGLGVNDDRTIE